MGFFRAVLLLVIAAAAAWAAAFGPVVALVAWVCVLGCALALLPPAKPDGDECGSRHLWPVLAFLFLLAAKDLAPAFPISGEPERRAALASSLLSWPATARNPALGSAAAQLAAMMLALAVVGLVHRNLAGSRHRALVALNFLAWSLTALGFAIVAGLPPGPYDAERHIGLIASKNSAGTLLGIAVLLQAGLAHIAWRRQTFVFAGAHFLAALGLLYPLAMVGSWTGFLALGAAAATYAWMNFGGDQGSWRRMALIALTSAVAVIVVATINSDAANRLPDLVRDYRWKIWADTLPMAFANPGFGIGLGAFESIYPLHGALELPYNARLLHPDSSWVLLWHEWGTLPLILALAAGITLATRTWRRLVHATQRGGPVRLGRLAASAAVGWLISGFTDVTLHRPESLLLGAALGGIALACAETAEEPLEWSLRRPLGLSLLAVALGLALWVVHVGQREIRWGLLDPTRLWNEAMKDRRAGTSTATWLGRLRAATRLQHTSVSYPYAAAELVHPLSPDDAFWFWQLAVQRAGSHGRDYFSRAIQSFPSTPPGYWVRLAQATDPDLALRVTTLPHGEQARAIAAWIARQTQHKIAPAVAQDLLEAVRRIGQPELLESAANNLETEAPNFWETIAALLQSIDHSQAAWLALTRAMPVPDAARFDTRPAPISPNLLLTLQRFAELRELLLSPNPRDNPPNLLLLQRICAVAEAPPWFHFQLARALAANGEHAAAVDRGLRALAFVRQARR